MISIKIVLLLIVLAIAIAAKALSIQSNSSSPTASPTEQGGYIIYEIYSSTDCSGPTMGTSAYLQNVCTGYNNTDNSIYTCVDNIPTYNFYAADLTCNGTAIASEPLSMMCTRYVYTIITLCNTLYTNVNIIIVMIMAVLILLHVLVPMLSLQTQVTIILYIYLTIILYIHLTIILYIYLSCCL